MICKNCCTNSTIKAHLIPRVFCKEVQEGVTHAANIIGNSFERTQSGIWDSNILCDVCDGKLGEYESYMYIVSKKIRNNFNYNMEDVRKIDNIDNSKVLRFCAGILYKYSLTTKKYGRIELGRYQEILREFIFNENSNIPDEIDVLIIRPLLSLNDNEVFAYRTPILDRKYNINVYRMMMGGLIFFVLLDKRDKSDFMLKNMLVKNFNGLPYLTLNARGFEEFDLAKKAIKYNERLSSFLDTCNPKQ